ncbi:hypothetical protein MTP99_001399 [Tenebrio molitor]|jgi:cytochrome P450 family 28|uniref:Cytochrome P450 monooxygenase CYP347A6 n=1 Tax=Tenebrio molitor TaxID=7067 RepID=A0A0K1YW80_TENMO|nr:cytochrome P450 monooxygenase CYP347A6 [Tenebrio molitor]KAJ3637984.1 hypothetical protein MTP99_001399 [Tenebrio molitor]
MIFILLIIVIAVGFYFFKSSYTYWDKRGVPGPKPKLFFGNFGQSFLFKKSPAEVYSDIYNDFPDASMVGVFRANSPTLIIRDPELIRDVAVKSFRNFQDNELIIDKKDDPLLGRHPFFIGGEEWRTTRVLLTPGFTSGKMKWIYPLLEDVSKQFIKFIEKRIESTKTETHNAKDLCVRFTLDNVTSCALGLEAKSFEEETNEFRYIADRFFTPEGWKNVVLYLVTIIPFLSKFVSVKFLSKEIEEKFTNIVVETLKYREANNIVRNDFLQMLHQMKKSSNDDSFTDLEITAHAAGFFGDSYETSSITMHFLLYELASNPEAQTKLREEIVKAFDENEKLPYEELQMMPYLDAVLNESLRLHPPLGSLNKMCTESYTYVPRDNDVIKKPVIIEAGTPVILPVYGLHRDPKYFDDPNSFKPERFIGTNKEKIVKYTYMPFGEGPRACLGQRFGILQIKMGIAYVIKNFEVSVNGRTKSPMKYNPIYFMTIPNDPLWLDFKKIV